MSDFLLVYEGFEPAEEGLREALTSTGNGYFCTRGCAEWEDANDTHYPGTYAHGVYNRRTTVMGIHPVPNEDLVNLPNWLVLKLRIEGDQPFRLTEVELLSYRHAYDIRNALVLRELCFRDRAGRETSLRSRRFVSMHRMHQGAIAWDLTPENWSGQVEVVSALDGRVVNQGVARYRQLEGRHLDPQGPRIEAPDVIALKARTRQSRIEIAEAARTRVYRGEEELEVIRHTYQSEDYVQQVLELELDEGATVRVEKLAAFYSSRDRGISEPLEAAVRSANRYPSFETALNGHTAAWDELWKVCDAQLPREQRVQFLMRFHAAHLLQVCSRLTAHHDAGVPARGLNGEAYRGHIFWDELFVYPFFNFRFPVITRALLLYRYRRIAEARAAARESGYEGAMFPWQSGSDGQEETQGVHLNPLTGQWDPDLSRNQRHVSAAIFYTVWHYHLATDDLDFLRDCGAEMMLEIARFWASIAHFNPERDRWEIHGVMGPDEFHEKYPGAAEGGLRNNAYTNVMAAWIFDTARTVIELLPASRREALMARIDLTDDEVGRWQEMSCRMFVPFNADGVISQFEGYEDLEELDWEGMRAKHGNIQRLDRILRAEGDDPNRYKVAKQADTLMLFFLFPDAELKRIFDRLGYGLSPEIARKTIDYYERRTSHGSTLSLIVHAGVLASIDPESSWERFLRALESDIGDIQGNTTPEGIHTGVMGGTLDLVQRIYLGAEIRDGAIHFDPGCPSGSMACRCRCRSTAARSGSASRGASSRSRPSPMASTCPSGLALARTFTSSTPARRARSPSASESASRNVWPMPAGFRGAIFDVDGVLVDSPHERAWRDTLRGLMETSWSDIRSRTTYSSERFTARVYRNVVAGKPRMSGARAALDYFDVPDAGTRVDDYAELKQERVVELIEAGEFTAFPDALRFVLAMRGCGVRIAAASSSKNAGLMLGQIRLDTFADEQGLDHDLLRPGLLLGDLSRSTSPAGTLRAASPIRRSSSPPARELGLSRGSASWSRMRSSASRPPGREAWQRSAWREGTMSSCSRTPAPTSSSRRSTRSPSIDSRRVDWRCGLTSQASSVSRPYWPPWKSSGRRRGRGARTRPCRGRASGRRPSTSAPPGRRTSPPRPRRAGSRGRSRSPARARPRRPDPRSDRRARTGRRPAR